MEKEAIESKKVSKTKLSHLEFNKKWQKSQKKNEQEI